jgi:hypothetical protein
MSMQNGSRGLETKPGNKWNKVLEQILRNGPSKVLDIAHVSVISPAGLSRDVLSVAFNRATRFRLLR